MASGVGVDTGDGSAVGSVVDVCVGCVEGLTGAEVGFPSAAGVQAERRSTREASRSGASFADFMLSLLQRDKSAIAGRGGGFAADHEVIGLPGVQIQNKSR